ncbi:MAG TPA: hypothetical protein PKD84_11970 [Propionicimonas sp.]|nr:hypothetical protein [Propionicimonas sp.]
MSDLQPPPPPPPPPPPGENTANPPGPGWTPASLSASGQATYAGKTSAPEPTSATSTTAPAINKFSPKRSLVPLIVTLITIVVAAAVLYTALNPPKPQAASTPSPSPAASQAPARPGTPFAVAYSDTSGVWQITKHRWTDRGLDVFVELTVDNGALDCAFNALSNSGQEVEKGLLSELTPQFDYTTITAGETRSGWVYFPMYERGTTLVFLRTLDQPQVSGIEISG